MKGVYQILSTLDIKKNIQLHIFITIFVLLFSIIYESFSHGVYSNYMIFAFLIPLLLGVVVFKILEITKTKINFLTINFYNATIITLVVGSLMKGFLDIYGTTNNLIYGYLIISGVLLLLTIITIKYID